MLAKVKVDVKGLDVAYRCKLEEFRVQVAPERRVQTGEHASKDVCCQDLVVDPTRSVDFLGR